ncbi:MAG TPA: universal stress protein [Solirubrobacteraceae bacterium]|nr:universal stress protein [Solirubrobacteraceae bacterium]
MSPVFSDDPEGARVVAEVREQWTEIPQALANRSRRACDAAHRDLISLGGAHTKIAESAAEIDASLVVIGSRGLHGLRALGSVGRRVAHHGHSSVLLVPPVSRRSAAGGRSPRPEAC